MSSYSSWSRARWTRTRSWRRPRSPSPRSRPWNRTCPSTAAAPSDGSGRPRKAETEAQRAYKTEQGRRWYKQNPNGADAVADATKAADAARKRTAEYLLATRLEQLRAMTTVRTEQVAPAPWTDRLPALAARPLDGDTAGAVIA